MRINPRTSTYLAELAKIVHVKNSGDVHKLELLHQSHGRLVKSRNTIFWLRILIYVLLYASILSSVTIILDLDYALPSMLDMLFTLVSMIGIVVSVVLVVVLSQSVDTYDSDIRILESHIIALYVKNDKSSEEVFREFLKKI